jgi:hypothetical protein
LSIQHKISAVIVIAVVWLATTAIVTVTQIGCTKLRSA